MYCGGITFAISKSFGTLQLIPDPNGLRFFYKTIGDANSLSAGEVPLDLILPLDAVGGLWATARAFINGVESLDENYILNRTGEQEAFVKLYRDRPRGDEGRLLGDETCWLRIVTGRSEAERRRIKLGPRDLLCLELACQSVLILAGEHGTHKPALVSEEGKATDKVGPVLALTGS